MVDFLLKLTGEITKRIILKSDSFSFHLGYLVALIAIIKMVLGQNIFEKTHTKLQVPEILLLSFARSKLDFRKSSFTANKYLVTVSSGDTRKGCAKC